MFSRSELRHLEQLIVSESCVLNSRNTTLYLVTNRRGTAVWRAEVRGHTLSVKCAVKESSDANQHGFSSIERERLVLSQVETIGQNYLVEAGQANTQESEYTFLICEWLWGPHALNGFMPVDGRVQSQTVKAGLATKLVPAMYTAIAPLHRAGWAHGDLQPDHLRWCNNELAVMDFGLAQSPAHPMRGYRGGLVHFNAPEVCQDILSRGEAVATSQADLFALASIVYFAMTGEFLGSYTMADSWRKKVEVLADGRYRSDPVEAFRTIPSSLRSVLLDSLSVDPSQRPTSAATILNS